MTLIILAILTHLLRSTLALSINTQHTKKLTFHIETSSDRYSLVRQPAPSFSTNAIIDQSITTYSSELLKGKYWLIFFYPLDFTFVCPTELISFSDRIKEFTDIQCEVIGCSVDSEYAHLAWIKTPRNEGGLGELKFPLLADVNRSISTSFGALLEKDGVSLRASFIIDPKGIVRHASFNDLPFGRSVDESLRLIHAIQSYDKHGEMCPANWQKGDKTVKVNTKDAK